MIRLSICNIVYTIRGTVLWRHSINLYLISRVRLVSLADGYHGLACHVVLLAGFPFGICSLHLMHE